MIRPAAQHTSPAPVVVGLQLVRYSAAGALGTALHYLTMFSLMAAFAVKPVVASTAGAILGALVNYGLNYRFTFRSDMPHRAAMPRFLLIAAIGLGLNALLLGWLLQLGGLPTLGAQLVATAGVLVFTFFANRTLTF